MRKNWLIFIYLFTHIGFVIRIIWNNYQKKQTKLSVAKLSQNDTPSFGNDVEIDFKQQGAILMVINGKFVFPLINEKGRFKIPVALIESNQVAISIIGLFQVCSKRLTLEIPLGANITKQLQPSQMLFERLRSIKILNKKIVPPIRFASQIRFNKRDSSLVFMKPNLTAKVAQLEIRQSSFPELLNEEQTLNKLNKIHSYEE